MYDELVKRLRMRAHLFKQINQMENCIMDEAADAIEELNCNYQLALGSMKKEYKRAEKAERQKPRWIPVTERLPSDFVSVQAHIVGAEPLPTVREAYVIGGKWFFPALKEFLPVDMWKRFDEPPKEE